MVQGLSQVRTIPLSQGLVAIVDAADFDMLSERKWHTQASGYAAHGSGSRPSGLILMHRLLMEAPAGLQVDHINGNRLDNRRANLRLCTAAQNRCNAGLRAVNKSGFKGVSRHSSNRVWVANVQAGGVAHYIGSYADKVEAARAYDAAALRLHGPFARLNFPEAA